MVIFVLEFILLVPLAALKIGLSRRESRFRRLRTTKCHAVQNSGYFKLTQYRPSRFVKSFTFPVSSRGASSGDVRHAPSLGMMPVLLVLLAWAVAAIVLVVWLIASKRKK